MQLSKLAFTLIELLVVIAIIGILSGLIVVSMSGVTQKANIAKGQVFSSSLKKALMLDLVSEWKLDEVFSSTTTPDSWKNINTGTLREAGYVGTCDTSHCPQLQTSNCVLGNCLLLDGVNDYVDCGSDSSLNITEHITISIWVYPLYSGANEQLIYYKGGPGFTSAGLRIGTKNGFLRINFWDGTNSRSIGDILYNTDKWYSLVFTGDKGGTMKIYVNGSLWSTTTPFTDGLVYDTTNLSLGGLGAYYFNGRIDEVRLYNNIVPTSQIKEQYYAGLNSLLANGNISAREYLLRLNETAQN